MKKKNTEVILVSRDTTRHPMKKFHEDCMLEILGLKSQSEKTVREAVLQLDFVRKPVDELV